MKALNRPKVLRRFGTTTILGVWMLVGGAAQGQVQPAFYAVGGNVTRVTESSLEISTVRTLLSGAVAVAIDPGGALIAVVPAIGVFRVEPQTGHFERVALLGLGFSGDADAAFDDRGNFWLSIRHQNEASLYRFDPDYGGRTRVGTVPLPVVGLTFRSGEMVVLAGESVYTVDPATLVPDLLAGPFPDDGIGLDSLAFHGLATSADGRLFTIAEETIPIGPPVPPSFAELELDRLELRLFGGIAAGVGPAIREEGCTPDDVTICLGAGRFAVTVDWLQPEVGLTPAAKTRFITREAGVFSFVGADNLEVTVKVLDACTLDDHYWVFAASATSLEHTVRVHDTFAERTQIYQQPAGGVPPITDTRAFATCSTP